MYECISGPAGKRNWHRLRSLYLEGARLIPTGKRACTRKASLQVMSIDEWIEDVQGYFEENDFYETEIVRHMDQFRQHYPGIQHLRSSGTTRTVQPMARGVNSIQLLEHEERWWIVTVILGK